MQVGDIIKFKKTGRVGTIIKVARDFIDDASPTAKVFIHNWSPSRHEKNNPHLFRLYHLRQVAEVISAGTQALENKPLQRKAEKEGAG